MSAPLITSHRLYNATAQAAKAWKALFSHVFEKLGLQVETIEHGWPLPVADLWQRPGLCAAFMCGWPFAKALAEGKGVQALAAPVPAFAPYRGKARYRSEFLARADSGWTRLEDSFGHRYGWMVRDSQSGWNAPRAHLAQYADAGRAALFSEVCGPFGNPRGLLQALHDRGIDITAVDSFYLDLMRADEPAALNGLSTIATTAWSPLPLLVAAADVDKAIVDNLCALLPSLHGDVVGRALLAQAHILRFDPVQPCEYLPLLQLERAAEQRGYSAIR